MIPKVIHYCWFGRNPLPPLAVKCINSWKKILPEYEIKEWNEDNFDLDAYPYAREAYDARKFAFVTDIARLYALYTEGGIYMDTDVEILKPLDPFLHHPAFSGFESDTLVPTGIMASEKGGIWAKENLELYNDKHFILSDGTFDTTTNVSTITNYMLKKGLKQNNTYQLFDNLIALYPKEYFCPIEHEGYKLVLTSNTVCIHYFAGSWVTGYTRYKKRISKILGTRITRVIISIKRFFKS